MSKMYYGSIDLNKIDKSKIVSTDKNGNPFDNGAKYMNIVVWVNDEPDQYGNNASVQMSVSKEEMESGVKGVYIGNLKTNENSVSTASTPQINNSPEDDFPF